MKKQAKGANRVLPLPHGGRLKHIPDLDINKFDESDLKHSLEITYENAITVMGIKTGILSPLEGFMAYSDYINVLKEQRLENGLPWSIPTLLTINGDADSVTEKNDKIILTVYNSGTVVTIAETSPRTAVIDSVEMSMALLPILSTRIPMEKTPNMAPKKSKDAAREKLAFETRKLGIMLKVLAPKT